MKKGGNIDPTLRALGDLGKYQMLQAVVQSIGNFGAAYQLLDNIFVGRDVEDFNCAPPPVSGNSSTEVFDELTPIGWNSSDVHVAYGQCEITVSRGNQSVETQRFDCTHGYNYSYPPEMSFRTEFDLVCDRELLGSLAQTLVILGQGIGAVLSSIVSDRFGRKRTLVASQVGLLVVGVLIALSPSYPVLAFLKFLVGGFQQGVITGIATMTIELFTTNRRSVQVLFHALFWATGSTSMTLFAYLLREYRWRYLQYALSGASLVIAVIQFFYLDESLRWLVANGRKEDVVRILKRAAKTNGKDLNIILKTLHEEHGHPGTELALKNPAVPNGEADGHDNPVFTTTTKDEMVSPTSKAPTSSVHEMNGTFVKVAPAQEANGEVPADVEMDLQEKQAKQLTAFDIFRHKRLLMNALITWTTWFTTAFSFFALYMMSTSLAGDRFMNYFLTAIMEIPPGIVLYFGVDKLGRKTATQWLFVITGIGLLASGICRYFDDIPALQTMSVVMAMAGMFGASGAFTAVFFFTPELFPTNMRNQALGVSSFAGRLGGMIAPFMADFAKIAIWGPGVTIGACCFVVVFLLKFLPETRGKELPHTIEDINAWYHEKDPKEKTAENGDL